MKRTRPLVLGALVLAVALAGCLGIGDDGGDSPAQTTPPPRSLEIQRHDADSEEVTASIGDVTGDVTYDDLVVTVDKTPYDFGADASFRDARYSVSGVSDASAAVEPGHVVTVPAAGDVDVSFRDGESGEVWDSFSVVVPDEDAPPTPENVAPANGAGQVPTTPTFEWNPIADPSGATYTLQVSLDESFSQDLVVEQYDGISSASFQPSSDDELAPGQTYYWHVRATDGEDNIGSWSPTWSFTTEPR